MINYKIVAGSILFSIIGIIILVVVFWIIEKIAPQNLWKEIVEKQNMALSLMASAFMIAIALIIAAAVHG